jgi:hypothetical protein
LRTGETAVAGKGHAEMKILAAAKKNKQTVTAVGASRKVCAQCEAEITKVNGTIQNPQTLGP